MCSKMDDCRNGKGKFSLFTDFWILLNIAVPLLLISALVIGDGSGICTLAHHVPPCSSA